MTLSLVLHYLYLLTRCACAALWLERAATPRPMSSRAAGVGATGQRRPRAGRLEEQQFWVLRGLFFAGHRLRRRAGLLLRSGTGRHGRASLAPGPRQLGPVARLRLLGERGGGGLRAGGVCRPVARYRNRPGDPLAASCQASPVTAAGVGRQLVSRRPHLSR